MAPQLVVAAAPYKIYPGGVIAFKCSEWLGASAGASTEIDARAIEGEVVRETQTTANTLISASNRSTAFAAADDSVTIDLSGIPLSATSQNDPGVTLPFFYDAFISVVIEGTWNASDAATYDHTPLRLDRACIIGFWGDVGHPTDGDHVALEFYPHGADSHYTMIGFQDLVHVSTGTEVLHIRALARSSSTIEILLDQLVLIPTAGGTSGIDNMLIAGGENTDPLITQIIDGPDGGNANGKFTWHPRRLNTEPVGTTLFSEIAGGGDYQQDDSEYFLDIPAADGYTFESISANEQTAHMYSLHGAYYRDSQIHETDSFTRTVASGFGTSPKGYPHRIDFGTNAASSVNGTRGKMHFTGSLPRANGRMAWQLDSSPKMRVANMAFSGDFEVVRTSGGGAWWDGVTTDVVVLIVLTRQAASEGPALGILFDVINSRWRAAAFTRIFVNTGSAPFTLDYPYEPMSDWIDASGWFTLGGLAGWRIELKRFRMRMRMWDAAGAEPSTWDFDDFHPLTSGASFTTPVWEDYPYSDDEELAARRQHATYVDWWHEMEPEITVGGNGYVAQWDAYFDNFEFESDPYGSIGDVHALVEAPKGNEFGRIQIPSGAWHFVYWGGGDFTDMENTLSGFSLDFAMKVWSESGAAELQRSEMPFLFFIWAGANLVSMNWREADRSGVATRVLVGE